MKKIVDLHTNREILECIYEIYRDEWISRQAVSETKGPYIPINLANVASKLGARPEELFGRLYYDLDRRYRYRQPWGPRGLNGRRRRASVHLFQVKDGAGEERHVVHLPYLAGILSDKRERHRDSLQAKKLAGWSMFIAISAVIAQVAQIIFGK